jgi:membrane associated rhomboid family serine protease
LSRFHPGRSSERRGAKPAATVRPDREPAFNAPWPVLAIAATILLAYLVQSSLGPSNPMVGAMALVPAELGPGRWWTPLTVVLVHGGWVHAGLNALGALAFGTPVARWFGPGGAGRFLLFYGVCAIAASIGYVALHQGQAAPLVGASGAISGLMGASARLLDRPGRLAPLGARTVLAMTLAWIAVNGLLALGWIDVGQGGAPVAWDAHLIGYATGLLLIGPFTPSTGR